MCEQTYGTTMPASSVRMGDKRSENHSITSQTTYFLALFSIQLWSNNEKNWRVINIDSIDVKSNLID